MYIFLNECDVFSPITHSTHVYTVISIALFILSLSIYLESWILTKMTLISIHTHLDGKIHPGSRHDFTYLQKWDWEEKVLEEDFLGLSISPFTIINVFGCSYYYYYCHPKMHLCFASPSQIRFWIYRWSEPAQAITLSTASETYFGSSSPYILCKTYTLQQRTLRASQRWSRMK